MNVKNRVRLISMVLSMHDPNQVKQLFATNACYGSAREVERVESMMSGIK
jgi:hypothetical protein